MKSIYTIITILLLFLVGCSSKAIKHEILEVKSETSELKTTIIEQPKPEPDEFEQLNRYAYEHYIYAIMLESDSPADLFGAAEHYKQALQYHPNSYQLRYSLAHTYLKLTKYADAIEVASIISPVDEFVYDLRGRSYIGLGKHDSSKTAFVQLAKAAPNNAVAYHYLSQFYRSTGTIDSLIWSYENLTRLLPYNDRYWQELGKLKAQVGEFETAQKAFESSLKLKDDRSNIISFVGLAEMYKIRRIVDSALITYKAALEVDPNNPALNTDAAMLYAQLDSLHQALPYARNAAEITPQDHLAVRRLAIIYYGIDSLNIADSIFTALVSSGERHYINHFYLGRIAALKDDYITAVEEFKILTQLSDSLVENWLDLGFAYRKLKDYPNEILTYKTGLTKVHNEIGKSKLLFSLGAVYEQADMYDSSTSVFKAIIEDEPDNHQALNYLGYMLADRGENLDYAKRIIEKANKLSPDNAAYLDSYGWVYYRLHDYKRALKHLKKAVSLAEDSIMYDHLGDVYKAKGEPENASVWWQKALDLDPDNKVLKNKLNE